MSAPVNTITKSETKGFANKTKVVRGLLTELLQGKWQAADRLTEAEACERFNVSRTPVREALFELQGLGLLEIRRNCGAVMLPFGPKELENIFRVRTLLEVEASRLAALQADVEQIGKLIEEFEENNGGEEAYWEHDQQLHHYVAKSSGNMSLAAEIARYHNLMQTMREIIEENSINIEVPETGEHVEILKCIKTGQPVEAGEAMRRHLERAVDSAVSAMESFRVAVA
ncbi:MAG: GntR family transcriptional regulator [Verrucomicrobiales bacterium]|nr:GntR family transcriptional regulator [Verrucomicrobiales bacterium]